MPKAAYSLIDQPWIPVRWTPDTPAPTSGKLPGHLGLRDLFLYSADLAGLAVAEAPAHSALLRILYALTARMTELDEEDPGDWGERRNDVWDEGRFSAEKVDKYFATYSSRFSLYDPEGGRPWMQDPRLAAQCDAGNTAGVNKLIVTRPSGNNHSWFRHDSDTAPILPTASEATLNLLVWHYYGPSGRCSAREVNGTKSASATAGPLRTALSYHPEGDTLFQTLLAGLTPPGTGVRRQDDLCPWEWDTLPDPDAPPRLSRGPCSRLTARSQHALLLVPDDENGQHVRDAFITWAYRGERMPREDDYLVWQISQQGNRYPRPADSSRALWRDLDALLLQNPPGSASPEPPRVFIWAPEVSEDLRVRALGFDQEGQAKDTQFVDAGTPAVLGFAESNDARSVLAVSRLRQLGEIYGRRLDRAVKRAWAAYVKDPKSDGGPWAAEAAARYWPSAEAEFWSRFRQLDRTRSVADGGFDPVSSRAAFLHLASDAYNAVTHSVTRTQRGSKAVSEARIDLFGGHRKKHSADPRTTTSAKAQETTR
ncbi:type I-E CRISPR-associated protein Cse1/CasA [Streptomyces sp. NBC_01500]|uniref:type I-E CRISPR-associated protein Cse1/CasA n=1 Tax=Streptomyces sp. NBC_01500 TaxID=2903886 RepID=UPI0022583D66|nr:type I-E CRISPR-associated protein Cse1/CasA [Streptomyces sp. NBC_01500]MCX4554287.1 type I-E CRISPR-associated protein Cse1/CasA [Streptomyces sp. NBC_01500]